MIRIENLEVCRNSSLLCHVPQLMLKPSQRLAVLGKNGSGKTTLLRVLAGLETTFRGQCHVNVPPRNRVFVHQSPYLFRGTVFANVAYGLAARGRRGPQARESVEQWLERLGIAHLSGRSVRQLSAGEARRTALARALVLRPTLLLLDEPLGDLDETGPDTLIAALQHLPQTTLVVASPTPLPAGMTDRTLGL